MFTKPLTRQKIATFDLTKDTDSITRLLVAAAINPRFCTNLLTNPQYAVQAGFGGETFPLSQPTLDIVASIQASTLPEFALKLNEMLANQLPAS
jgi:hypothetical protein